MPIDIVPFEDAARRAPIGGYAGDLAVLIENLDLKEAFHGNSKVAGPVTRRHQTSRFPVPAIALSPRERGVMQLICRGLSNKSIARELQIAPETVKSHAKHILVKLKARTRAEAVARAAGMNVW
jgi:DNA-binding NarL/FixJ family response regulator